MPDSEPYDPELTAILEPRTHEEELFGFRGGRFSPDRTKFVAYTYARLDLVEYYDYQAMFMEFGRHSSIGTDTEKEKKWVDQHSYQMKDMEECIKEGIYLAWSIRFFGMLYKGEWFVQKELMYWGEQMQEEKAIAWLTGWLDVPDFWEKGSFGPPMHINLPGVGPVRHIDEEEFPGVPLLVSSIKIEAKSKIKQAFEQYMNLALVQPFLQRMRIRFPDEFVDFSSLFGYYTLLYPRDRTFFLLVTMARHRTRGWRLAWFFYEPSEAVFFRWIHPKPRYSDHSYWYLEDVIEDLKDISDWNDCGFLNSSRTLDDPEFWSRYVLAQEDGRYRWLEPIVGER